MVTLYIMNRVFNGQFKFKAIYKHCQIPDLALRTKAKEQNVKKLFLGTAVIKVFHYHQFIN
ncbi:hypothetical protein SAMN03080602_04252 [Arenibacter troitsensis]|uniref:Uncharacterized protein n=1 Tax=Arenibacter troitsensis TaxID=188872 RepID=A0A1X7LF88_9FLAO|nr:hypothetical protein SAMN03080602_04252 [Arenibacter troitsensis]